MLGNFSNNHNTSIPRTSENRVLTNLSRLNNGEKDNFEQTSTKVDINKVEN